MTQSTEQDHSYVYVDDVNGIRPLIKVFLL